MLMESENKQLELLKDRIKYNQRKFENIDVYEKTLERLLEDSKIL